MRQTGLSWFQRACLRLRRGSFAGCHLRAIIAKLAAPRSLEPPASLSSRPKLPRVTFSYAVAGPVLQDHPAHHRWWRHSRQFPASSAPHFANPLFLGAPPRFVLLVRNLLLSGLRRHGFGRAQRRFPPPED